jgi:hypothetical protein
MIEPTNTMTTTQLNELEREESTDIYVRTGT